MYSCNPSYSKPGLEVYSYNLSYFKNLVWRYTPGYPSFSRSLICRYAPLIPATPENCSVGILLKSQLLQKPCLQVYSCNLSYSRSLVCKNTPVMPFTQEDTLGKFPHSRPSQVIYLKIRKLYLNKLLRIISK